jgi:hypothetical protein
MADDESSDARTLALAVRQLRDAVHHYESIVLWDTTCQRCGRLLDQLYAADRRCEQVEAALGVALTRRPEP